MHAVAPDAEITEETETMIRKALAKDPEQRQQSMEEFHRDLQKCYGQVRFRRTLKTPRGQVPAVAAIPLTKKKIPSGDANGAAKEAVVIEMEAGIPSPMSPSSTPLPGEGPILLTKKKAPPARVEAPPSPATPDPTAQPATPPAPRKRTTLPLGTEGASTIPSPAPEPPKTEKTSRFPGPGRNGQLASLPVRANGAGHEPRPPVRRDSESGEDLDRSWTDEPTVPGASAARLEGRAAVGAAGTRPPAPGAKANADDGSGRG